MHKKIKIILVAMLTTLLFLCTAALVAEYFYPFQEQLVPLFLPEPPRPY